MANSYLELKEEVPSREKKVFIIELRDALWSGTGLGVEARLVSQALSDAGLSVEIAAFLSAPDVLEDLFTRISTQGRAAISCTPQSLAEAETYTKFMERLASAGICVFESSAVVEPDAPISRATQIGAGVFLTVLSTARPFAITLTQASDGKYNFSVGVANFLVGILVLLLGIVCTRVKSSSLRDGWSQVTSSFQFFWRSCLVVLGAAMDGFLHFFVLQVMDLTLATLLYQALLIIFTAVLSFTVLGKTFNMSILLLIVSTALQIPTFCLTETPSTLNTHGAMGSQFHNISIFGLMLLVVQVFITASVVVLQEKLMRGSGGLAQHVFIVYWGVWTSIFAGVYVCVCALIPADVLSMDLVQELPVTSWFGGFDSGAWIMLMLLALRRLASTMVLKYLSAFTKGFLEALALVLVVHVDWMIGDSAFSLINELVAMTLIVTVLHVSVSKPKPAKPEVPRSCNEALHELIRMALETCGLANVKVVQQ